jgi:putative transposase
MRVRKPWKRTWQRFKSQGAAQLFLAIHAAFYNVFYVQRHLLSRRSFRHRRSETTKLWAAATA